MVRAADKVLNAAPTANDDGALVETGLPVGPSILALMLLNGSTAIEKSALKKKNS